MPTLEESALAFAALQRFWVLYEPAFAETAWRRAFAFLALPPEQRKPGSWYQHEGDTGFIEYKMAGDEGEFHRELPADVDPASVIVVPRIQGIPSVFDRMRQLLLDAAGNTVPPAVQTILDDITELQSESHDSRLKSRFCSDGLSRLMAGSLTAYVAEQFQSLSVEGLNQSRVKGIEVAALMLLDSLLRQLSGAPASLPGKMLDPFGVASLPDLTARFIVDCCNAGQIAAMDAAIEDIRKGGDGTLAAARELPLMEIHPGLYMDGYYARLQQAGIRFLAARWGCQSALVCGTLDDKMRAKLEKRANAAEEKFVRMNTALLYAIQNLDGTRYRQHQAEIRDARSTGDQTKIDALLFNVFDSEMFYPKVMRDVMLNGA